MIPKDLRVGDVVQVDHVETEGRDQKTVFGFSSTVDVVHRENGKVVSFTFTCGHGYTYFHEGTLVFGDPSNKVLKVTCL